MAHLEIHRIDLACSNFEETIRFYEEIFNIDFRRVEEDWGYGFKSELGDIEFMIVPNDFVNVKAERSRHQLHFTVADLGRVLAIARNYGGWIGAEEKQADGISVRLADPDKNPLVFVQIQLQKNETSS